MNKLKRNLLQFPIAEEILVDIMTEGSEIKEKCIKGIPSDAIYIGIVYNEEQQTYYLIFSHPTFPEIDYGCRIPIGALLFQKI